LETFGNHASTKIKTTMARICHWRSKKSLKLKTGRRQLRIEHGETWLRRRNPTKGCNAKWWWWWWLQWFRNVANIDMTHRQDVYYIEAAYRMSHILVMNMDASTSHIPYYVLRGRSPSGVTWHNQDITHGGEWKINAQVHRLWTSLLKPNHSVGDICVWLIRWVIDDITKCCSRCVTYRKYMPLTTSTLCQFKQMFR
jgi:hypothetical protein